MNETRCPLCNAPLNVDAHVSAACRCPICGFDLSRFAASLGLPVRSLSPDTRFVEDLGADSLDTVELVMELEEEFGINIPDDEAENIKTVGDALRLIEKYRDDPPLT